MVMDGPEVELLDTRPPRPGRLRRQVLAGVVVVAAVGALIVARSQGDGSPTASSSSSRPRATIGESAPPSAPAPAPAIGVVTSSDVTFARIGTTVYALDDGVLITVDLQTGRRREWPAVPANADRYAMVADPAGTLVWLVAATDTRAMVEALNPATLEVIGRRQVLRSQFMSAAAFDGVLYVGMTSGTFLIAPGGGSRAYTAPAMGGMPLALAADPSRYRILATVIREGNVVVGAWSEGRERPDVVATSAIGKGALVTAGGRIWAVGFGPHAVLARLDPKTLHAVRHSPLERQLGAGAVLVDSAREHLLVRAGAGNADLWCLDAGSGAVVRHWGAAAGTAVLTSQGVVVLAPGRPLIRLPSGACRG